MDGVLRVTSERLSYGTFGAMEESGKMTMETIKPFVEWTKRKLLSRTLKLIFLRCQKKTIFLSCGFLKCWKHIWTINLYDLSFAFFSKCSISREEVFCQLKIIRIKSKLIRVWTKITFEKLLHAKNYARLWRICEN